MKKRKKKHLSEYMWIISALYLFLGLFNMLFAWLGLLCFLIPLMISLLGGGKAYCNTYCGRGQLLNILGNKYKLSRNKPMPKFLKHKYFRYGFVSLDLETGKRTIKKSGRWIREVSETNQFEY